jgi:DNA mismatch repair protein MutS2
VSKLMLWWRGYRFSNDELVDRWLDHVFQAITHFLPPCFQLLGHMEVYLAALHFRDQCKAKGLDVCFPELVDSGGREIRGLFNPLLFKQGVVPTPCDITTDGFDTISIVTGPNSGGKTRLLQALGLTQLLGQAGLYAPATSARLRPASGMFVSLIDRPKAEQEEGRLGTELIRIRRLFETSHGGALVILDELCSGTNPSEGEEIFHLVLSLLEELGAEAFITTHFLEFARRLADENEPLRLRFFQVELDEHQRPTYGFVPGVATTSLAAQTAARLGVTREELMSLVRRNKRG